MSALLVALWLGVSTVGLAQGAGAPRNVGADPRPAIRVLTWNVLAPTAGERVMGWLGAGGQAGRARALLQQAKGLDADILAFQEVDVGFHGRPPGRTRLGCCGLIGTDTLLTHP
jgi:hypothetical protein